jgi:transcription termination/antitermination protein NusG
MSGHSEFVRHQVLQNEGILTPPPYWYAVHTRSNFEVRVADQFSAKGIENYLPAYEEMHQWQDRKRKVMVPLFPGYVFVRIGQHTRMRLPLLQTSGVVRIVGQGGTDEPVSDHEVEAIRSVLKSNLPCFAHPFLRQGAWVRVKRGPLKGVEGFLVRLKKQSRLVISVNVLSQSVATEVDCSDVELVRCAPVS